MSDYLSEYLRVVTSIVGFTPEDILNQVTLPPTVWETLSQISSNPNQNTLTEVPLNLVDVSRVTTINGLRLLPYPIAVIIFYHRDCELMRLLNETIDETSYETKAIEVRAKYNDIIDCYHNQLLLNARDICVVC